MASLPPEDQGLLEDLDQLEAAISAGPKAPLPSMARPRPWPGRKAALEQDFGNPGRHEVADLEVLVKALGPDGLRRDLLAGILEDSWGR